MHNDDVMHNDDLDEVHNIIGRYAMQCMQRLSPAATWSENMMVRTHARGARILLTGFEQFERLGLA